MSHGKTVSNRLLNIILILCIALSSFAFSAEDSNAATATTEYIAHRGWSSKAPENTLPAFRLAAKNSRFCGVEFDIWESSAEKKAVKTETLVDEEGNPVLDENGDPQTKEVPADPLLLVMHDENISRMCGVNKSIRRITRKTLNKYTITNGSKVSKYPDLKIPTADEALNTIWENSNGAIPVIELKHRLSKIALGYLFDLIGDHRVMIISFEYKAVTDAVKMAEKRGVSDNVQTMYLMFNISEDRYRSTALRLKKAGIDCISLKYTGVRKKTVKAFHRQGIKVCVWTIPNKKTARKYAGMGVDYITANGKVY